MSVTLDQLIENLKRKYNFDRQNIINDYNTSVRNIQTSKISVHLKQQFINQIINSTNDKLRNLLNKLNQDIANLRNQYKPFVDIQVSQTQSNKPPVVNAVVRKPIKRALLIGINYKGTQNTLYGCINDINNVERLIKENYQYTDILKLTDDTLVKPTRQNILDELKRVLNKSVEGDSIFFHFSGHGYYTIDRNNEETDGRDELMITLDMKGITDDELKLLIQNNLKPGVNLFCLFDCCHSGTMLDLRYQYLDSTNYDKDTQNEKQLLTPSNCIMISGCLDSQTSADAWVNRQAQGAMSWSFLECLNQSKDLTWKQLLQNMRTLLKGSQFQQIPQLSSGKSLDINNKISL